MVLPVVGVMTKNLEKLSLNAELVSSESDSSAKNRFRDWSVLLCEDASMLKKNSSRRPPTHHGAQMGVGSQIPSDVT